MSQFFSAGLFDSAIPDSAVLWAAADDLSLSDGETVSTWPDQSDSGNDLSALGAPVFRDSRLNGLPTVDYDGTDDGHEVTGPSLSQPNTLIVVGRIFDTTSTNFFIDGADSTARNGIYGNGNTEAWRAYAGSSIEGGAPRSTDFVILIAVIDGASSILRRNGTQIASGDVGSDDMGGIRLASDADAATWMNGDIAEVVVCESRLSDSQIQDQEQRLSDKWGISIA